MLLAFLTLLDGLSSDEKSSLYQSIGMGALKYFILKFIILFIAAKSEKIINKRIISVISRIVAIILAGLGFCAW